MPQNRKLSNIEEMSRKRGTIEAAQKIAADFAATNGKLDKMKDKLSFSNSREHFWMRKDKIKKNKVNLQVKMKVNDHEEIQKLINKSQLIADPMRMGRLPLFNNSFFMQDPITFGDFNSDVH